MAYSVELTIFLDDRSLQKVAKSKIYSLPFVFSPIISRIERCTTFSSLETKW